MITAPALSISPEKVCFFIVKAREFDAREATRLHNRRTAAYLLAKPMLADHLEEGLSLFGCSCEDYGMGRL